MIVDLGNLQSADIVIHFEEHNWKVNHHRLQLLQIDVDLKF